MEKLKCWMGDEMADIFKTWCARNEVLYLENTWEGSDRRQLIVSKDDWEEWRNYILAGTAEEEATRQRDEVRVENTRLREEVSKLERKSEVDQNAIGALSNIIVENEKCVLNHDGKARSLQRIVDERDRDIARLGKLLEDNHIPIPPM